MTTIDSNHLLSASLNDAVPTKANAATPYLCDKRPEIAEREAWQKFIDYNLIEWGLSRDAFDDEDCEPPTLGVLQLAAECAALLRDQGLPAPDTVVPDADGGIVFELRSNGSAEVFHFWRDGSVEYQHFLGSELVERETIVR